MITRRKKENSRYHDIVVKLTRMTANGELEWRRVSEPNLIGGQSDAFVADHNGRIFRIQDALSYAQSRGNSDIGEGTFAVTNRRRHVLEVTGGSENKKIVFPKMRAVDNLAQLIKSHEKDDLQDLERSLDS